MPTRRHWLRIALLAACAAARSARATPLSFSAVLPSAAAPPRHCWEAFKRRFVLADGRVIDTGNGGISHTEGQGWGLLFAVAHNDPDTFDRILTWTSHTLRRPHDLLHAWRYDPHAANPVADLNSATDGDVFIASALWRASIAWGRPDLAAAASDLARDLLRLLIRRVGTRLVLLPGTAGFETADVLVLNLSYYAFPMMEDLARACPNPAWDRLCADALSLISEGRFGRWGLPPDWLAIRKIDGALGPAADRPARFSYDAIRIPLWLAWSNLAPPAVKAAFTNYWSAFPAGVPAWVDLKTDEIAPYASGAGMIAVQKMVCTDWTCPKLPEFPPIDAAPDYYSAALIELSRLAVEARLSYRSGDTR
jgi:endoglucanase